MDIAFIDVTVTRSYGGLQTAVWQTAAALAERGHRVTVYGGDGPIRPDLGGRAVSVKTFPFTPRERYPNLGTRFRKLAERHSFLRAAQADFDAAEHDWAIVTKPYDFLWPWRSRAATRFAFLSGGTDFFLGDRRLAEHVDVFLACSQFNAWQLYGHFGRSAAVVYNGVDVNSFNPACRDPGLREQLGIAPDEVVFAFAGRLVGWKGVHLAVQALATAPLAGLKAKLLVVGDGAALAGLRRDAAAAGVAERVLFHAAVAHHELPRIYASADVGIFPSLGDEAFGITVAEAMACGLPVVAAYNGGIPEVVGNEGSCGQLFTVGDVLGCARAMAELARLSDEQRRQRGAAARQRVTERYTWALAAERVEAAMLATAPR
ncbi:MAG TPA: glycosyltransferase family 4 protein [Rhodocyclaceae bacterium]